MVTVLRDRREGGRLLAAKLRRFAGRPDVVVLGLPRGGIPVAHEVARALGTPLDAFVVRKLGVPGYEELAMGAIAAGGVRALDRATIEQLGIRREAVEAVLAREERELERRERLYRGARPAPAVRGRTVILVDDGLATGASMRAAIAALRAQEPAAIVVAAPVGAASTCEEMRRIADGCVCVVTPEPFYGVGAWYADFSQTTDAEVRELLDDAPRHSAPALSSA
ncbi:MAG TPA: phosphoribosyltransferase family protein [Gemmatimonadaceae bacterium]